MNWVLNQNCVWVYVEKKEEKKVRCENSMNVMCKYWLRIIYTCTHRECSTSKSTQMGLQTGHWTVQHAVCMVFLFLVSWLMPNIAKTQLVWFKLFTLIPVGKEFMSFEILNMTSETGQQCIITQELQDGRHWTIKDTVTVLMVIQGRQPVTIAEHRSHGWPDLRQLGASVELRLHIFLQD